MSVIFKKLDISGKKVRLRQIRRTDAEKAYPLLKNDAILSKIAWDGPNNQEEVYDAYSRWVKEMKNGEGCRLAIELCEQSGIIGCIDIRFPRHPQQADIGYWLGEPFWNQGYMTDAVRLACYLSFHYLDAVKTAAGVFVGNTGSRRALEKNGFSLDGTMRSQFYKHGRWNDIWLFSLLRSEWESRQDYYLPDNEDIIITGKKL
jgi:ribosomal-protein-alanine N-acetyltransferase